MLIQSVYGRRREDIKGKDFTGQKIGHLTVEEMLYGYGKHGETYCRCKCECGNEVIKSSYDIRHSANPAHCGCMTKHYKTIQNRNSRKDLTGQRFGRLVVNEMIYLDGEHTRVRCTCDCGNQIERIATYLTCGDTTSCGCLQKERASEANGKDFSGVKSQYGVELIERDHKSDRGVWMWKCRCPLCGSVFVALPAKILNGHITSCGCARTSSRERLIRSVLEKENIVYDPEHIFDGLKSASGKPLRFDFYLPEYSLCIEYQGEQHYGPVEIYGGEEEYRHRIEHDEMKRKYCKENHITLLEIPYTLSDAEIEEEIMSIKNP